MKGGCGLFGREGNGFWKLPLPPSGLGGQVAVEKGGLRDERRELHPRLTAEGGAKGAARKCWRR